MRLDEYEGYDGVGLAELIRRKEVTPAELLDVALGALDARNPALNAVVHDLRDRARRRLAEHRPPPHDPDQSPLHGVPFLVKDNLEIQDTPTTFGSVLTRDYVSPRTHPVARALEDDAGLVVLGRTNMCELGLLPTTEPLLHGPTRNPWAPGRSPGGSSGGSASAVAAGIVPLAHANDGGGSIRIPASACGLFGLKPSAGRGPAAVADHPSGFIAELAVSRTVRDSAVLLDVLSRAPSAEGARSWRRPPPPDRSYATLAQEDPPALRIGFRDADFHDRPAHPDCRAAVATAARLLEDLGHRVDEASPPIDADRFDASFLTLWSMSIGYVMTIARRALTRRTGRLPGPFRDLLAQDQVLFAAARMRLGAPPLEPITRKLLRLERAKTPGDVWDAWRGLNEAAQALERFFDRFDVLLTPVLAEPPWTIGHLAAGMSTDVLRDALRAYAPFTPIGNTSGAPAMSVPLHWNDDGVPIGVQLLAPFGREDRLVALAGQLERAQPWADRRPSPRGPIPA